MKNVAIVCIALLLVSSVYAQVESFPSTTGIQGSLRNLTTNAVINDSVTFNITLNNVSSGSSIYSEEVTNKNVSNGIFDHVLGLVSNLDPGIFLSSVSAILRVDSDNYGEVNFTSVPYAFVSKWANNSFHLGGTIASDYATKSYTDSLNGTWEDNSDNLSGVDIIAMVGNWTGDKPSYYTSAQVDALNGTWQDNSDNLTSSDIEAFGYYHTANNVTDAIGNHANLSGSDVVSMVGSWSADQSNY
jgi:hypothetical protein